MFPKLQSVSSLELLLGLLAVLAVAARFASHQEQHPFRDVMCCQGSLPPRLLESTLVDHRQPVIFG